MIRAVRVLLIRTVGLCGVMQLSSGGSEATSLEELPLSVVKAMPLHG